MTLKVKGFAPIGAVCCRCGMELRNDHGFELTDGSSLCRNYMSCSRRVSAKHLEELKQRGETPRWRKPQ